MEFEGEYFTDVHREFPEVVNNQIKLSGLFLSSILSIKLEVRYSPSARRKLEALSIGSSKKSKSIPSMLNR